MKQKVFEPPRLVKNKVARYILNSLVATAAIPIFLSSPFGLYYLVKGAARVYFRKYDFNREIKRLEKRNYVALTKTPKGWLVRLGEKGKRRSQAMKIEDLKLPIKDKWDKKWRIFIFDIPEKERIKRDLLRKKLKTLGLYNMQRSVFAFPFDCREALKDLVEYYRVGKYTTFLEADNIDIDRELRRHFNLS